MTFYVMQPASVQEDEGLTSFISTATTYEEARQIIAGLVTRAGGYLGPQDFKIAEDLPAPLPADAPRRVMRTFYLTPEEDEELRLLAFRTGIRHNDIIVEGLTKLLQASRS